MEDFIVLLMLVSAVYKDNIFSLVILAAILVFMISRKVRKLRGLTFVIGLVMLL